MKSEEGSRREEALGLRNLGEEVFQDITAGRSSTKSVAVVVGENVFKERKPWKDLRESQGIVA